MPTTAKTKVPLTTGVVVAVILSIGICLALNLLVFAVFWDAIYSSNSGISENATQILTGWGGGIIGVIGALVGYKAGSDERHNAESIATQAADQAATQATENGYLAAPVEEGVTPTNWNAGMT